MKEISFIRQNHDKWSAYEKTIGERLDTLSPDELHDIYADVLADLSLAQAHYPQSRLVPYLNGMARRLHHSIYVPAKRGLLTSFADMMLRDAPAVVYDARREILLALGLFLFFVLGGVVSVMVDPDDVVNVLGSNYVEMTIENIKMGKPTNIYDMDEGQTMFLEILWNNVWVSLKMFIYGIIPFVGTTLFLQGNGVMVGEFQSLFFLHGCGLQSAAAIWIHGTLEMSAMVVAAGASFALGRAWLLRGTYTMMDSLRIGGLRSVKILLSSLPLTFCAALLESFVTRHVEWPLAVRLSFIILSIIFVLWYYVYLPYSHHVKKGGLHA